MKKIKNIILLEYEISKKGDLNNKDILEIDKINKKTEKNIFEIKPDFRVKAKQFVGVVKINNKNISILPKIFSKNNAKNDENYIIKNLLYMFSYTKKINIKETDIANLGKTNNLFEVFIYIFAKNLLELLKKSFTKNYNLTEENSTFLKGKLLFSQHIKNNVFNKSKFFIEYEKMDENILLNIFLKSCSEKLSKITTSTENYKLLKKINFILQGIDNLQFQNISDLKNIKFNKQNKFYKNTFSLAKMLYFGNSPDFSKNNTQNFSLLFDMNILFEEFIAEFMRKNKDKIDKNLTSVNSQVSNKYVFKNNKFNLRPDIILEYHDGKKIIIDTKYKKLDINKTNHGVNSSDIYQMFMYGVRYFKKENKEKKIILLYPNYDGKNYENEYCSEENIKIFIKTINLNLDLTCTKGKIKLIKEIKNTLKNN